MVPMGDDVTVAPDVTVSEDVMVTGDVKVKIGKQVPDAVRDGDPRVHMDTMPKGLSLSRRARNLLSF